MIAKINTVSIWFFYPLFIAVFLLEALAFENVTSVTEAPRGEAFNSTPKSIDLVVKNGRTKVKTTGSMLTPADQESTKNSVGQDVNNNVLLEDPCWYEGTCRKSDEGENLSCYCDEACFLFNDCCIDAREAENKDDLLQTIAKKIPYISCENIQFGTELKEKVGSYLISRCPIDYIVEDVSRSCDLGVMFPVNTADGITYKNVYCAYCHGNTNYEAWRLELMYLNCKYDGLSVLNESNIFNKIKYLMDADCRYRFIPPNIENIRTCYILQMSQPINTLNDTLCKKFLNPVVLYDRGKPSIFRNFFCTSKEMSANLQLGCIQFRSEISDRFEYNKLTLTRLFNVRPVLQVGKQKICGINETYEPGSGSCVLNFCTGSDDKMCNMEFTRNFQWVTTKINFLTNDDLVFGRPVSRMMERIMTFFYLSMPREKYDFYFRKGSGWISCGNVFSSTNSTDCCFFNGSLELTIKNEYTDDEIKDFLLQTEQMTWTYTEFGPKMNFTVWHTDEDIKEAHNMYNFTQKKRVLVRINIFDGYTEERFIFDDINRSKSEVPEYFEGLVLIKDTIGAEEIHIKQWTFQYKSYNSTILLIPSYSTTWSLATVMTYITMGISCVSLCVTLAMYRVLGLCFSQPGIISQNMMGTLLVAQIIFLVGAGAVKIKLLCLIIGIILHYAWLSAFTWTTVFLFNVLVMMRRIKSSPGESVKVQKMAKPMYVGPILVPIAIVLPCVILELFSDFDIGYVDGICFPTGYKANIFFFALPVLLSLATNVIALAYSSFSISRFNNTTILSSSVRKNRSFIPIYIRLSLLCAFPWIMGILADCYQSEILSLIFIILSGSQGLIVSISFMTAKSVRNKLRAYYTSDCPQSDQQMHQQIRHIQQQITVYQISDTFYSTRERSTRKDTATST